MSEQLALSDRTLAWAAASVHPQAIVLSARRLHGGVSTPIHALSLSIDGDVRDVVLRQFDDAEWLSKEPDLVRREAASLALASRAQGANPPRVIAIDEDGSLTGKPSTLMTKLEGDVVLRPPDLPMWLRGLAQTLVRLHAVEPDGVFPWTFKPYTDARRMDYAWSKLREQWRTAISIVTGAAPDTKRRFIHRDYHPANVLWTGGKVSGVVDWVNGCIGPAGVDVGHCRVNLAQLHGIQVADEFLSYYRELAGESFRYDPYWDLVTLIDFADGPQGVYPGWTALGFEGLTDELVRERLEAYLLSLLARVNRS